MKQPVARSVRLRVESLENRTTPVVGKFDLPPIVQPGTGYDGVVQVITDAGNAGTGTLLPSGRHILTSAHVVAALNADGTGFNVLPSTVFFDMPNVGRIGIPVTAANTSVNPNYLNSLSNNDVDAQQNNDIAVLTLPNLAPSGPAGVGAERFNLYRTTDEIGKQITLVGYGRTGTGNTGEQTPIDNQKRIGRNRYDVLGEQLGYRAGSSLLYDMDNGNPANDAFGRMFGVNDLGLPDEGTSARGDSGGPVFITVNGQRFIAGVVTSGPKPTQPRNPAELNPQSDAGFGSVSHDTRVSSFLGFIEGVTNPAAAVTLDLRTQVVGQDDVADQILVRMNGSNLELLVNGALYQSMPLTSVTSLTLIGAGAGTPFATTATIQNGVPLGLTINYQRILQAQDNRTPNTPPANPPTNAPAPAPPPAPAATPVPENRPEPNIDLGNVPNLLTPSLLFAASGGGTVKVYDPQAGNKVVKEFQPFPGFTGPLSTAFGDVNGDLVKDLVVGAGAGGGPHVKVFDGRTFAELRSFFAYDVGFRGGVNVSTGDISGDGVVDIVTGAAAGGGPHVKVFDGQTNAVIRNFFAYDVGFRGGVSVSAGDTNNDGFDDIVTGAGAGGGPHVKVFDGQTNAVIRNFFAYDIGFRGGVNVTCGDIDGDGAMDVITGTGAGGASHVRVFDSATGQDRWNWFAYDSGFTGGVSVAAIDADNDGLVDIVTGAGPGGGPHVKVFGGPNLTPIRNLFAFQTTATFGVAVGGAG